MDPILLVDDDRLFLISLARTLRSAGLDALQAQSGDEALALIEERDFPLLLTDQVMPGMTGIELIERAKKLRPNLICILMSGYIGPADADAIEGNGKIFRFVQKPFGLPDLLDAVHDALDDARAPAGAPSSRFAFSDDEAPHAIWRLALSSHVRQEGGYRHGEQQEAEGPPPANCPRPPSYRWTQPLAWLGSRLQAMLAPGYTSPAM